MTVPAPSPPPPFDRPAGLERDLEVMFERYAVRDILRSIARTMMRPGGDSEMETRIDKVILDLTEIDW